MAGLVVERNIFYYDALVKLANLFVTDLELGSRMLLMPPSLTLILRHRLDSVWGEVLFTFLDCTH